MKLAFSFSNLIGQHVCASKPPFVWKTLASSVVAPVYEKPSEEELVCVNSVKRNNKGHVFLKLSFSSLNSVSEFGVTKRFGDMRRHYSSSLSVANHNIITFQQS